MVSSSAAVQANSTPKRNTKMAPKQSVNVNHLLNFSLPPRETRPVSSIPRRSRKTGTVQGVWNKERFVNAQYRFVMNPNGDYTVHFADADIFFQWNDILQVIVPRSSPFARASGGDAHAEGQTACPICLSPPAAPRMTKCGHIYCFPCILHYLSTSENKWARCPICFDSVTARQLKNVKWYDGPTYSENTHDGQTPALRAGSTLEMRLIQRPQITTLALPRSQTWPSDLLSPHQAPFHFQPDVLNFAKFMLATPEYLVAELTQQLEELARERQTYVGMKDDLGLYFVNEAFESVRHQIVKAEALNNPALKLQIEKAQRDEKELLDRSALQARRQEAEQEARSGKEVNHDDQDVPSDFLASRAPAPLAPASIPQRGTSQGRSNPRQRRNLNPPPPSTSTYYYYQAASGLPIFLHPIDIRILVSHFNGYSSFPDSITVRVDGTSESTVNDDLRKRCKYLGHLPEGADVIFVEANLEGVVGAEGLKDFEKVLKSRSTKRQEKVKKDDRAKARAEKEEKEKERLALARFTHTPVRPRSDLAPAEFVSLSTAPHGSPESLDGDGSVATGTSPLVPGPAATGAWGSRPSFASALHSSSNNNGGSARAGSGQQRRRDLTEEDWEADQMWHDLEQRALTEGGRKKRGTRMVVLGGSGAPSSRRR